MRLKLFSCHHMAPRFPCNTPIFQSFVSNLPEPADGSFVSDLAGETLAGRNTFAEMRQQYHVWRNAFGAYDYVGFEHYRRSLFIDVMDAPRLAAEFPHVLGMRYFFAANAVTGVRKETAGFAEHLAMRRAMDADDIAAAKALLGGYDVVVPKANDGSLEAQWKSCRPAVCWDVMVEGVRASRYAASRPVPMQLDVNRCYFANIYIMRTELMDEYFRFCFEVLAFCDGRVPPDDRTLGCLAERLFSLWLAQTRIERPALRVLELPFVFHDPAMDPA